MDTKKLPFTRITPHDILRPWLQIVIINPHNQRRVRVLGLIDTGADECALLARYAALLGHNLEAGKTKEINTGNGKTIAYSHTINMETGNFMSNDILIDFMPNLNIPLIGVKSFLSNFILTINYLQKYFSLASE